MMLTINDLYNDAHTESVNTPLLSRYTSDFWQEYIDNYNDYDALFNRMFYSFKYFLQNEGEDVHEVRMRFTEDVKRHLLLNDKKYSELYRVYVLQDSDMPLSDFKTTEKMDKDSAFNKGERVDTNTNSIGSQNNSITRKVSPYDDENFFNDGNDTTTLGARSDSGSYTSGRQEDTATEDYTKTVEGYNNGMTNVLKRHNKFWSGYEFMEFIFKEIEKALLLV